MYVHHIGGAFVFYYTNLLEVQAFSIFNLLTEVSTFFMHYRQFLFIHEMKDSLLMLINSVCFFLLFVFGRIVYQTYILYLVFLTDYQKILLKDDFTKQETFIAYLMIGFQVIIFCLNSYWLSLILKQVQRMLSKKTPSAKKVE